MADGGEDIEALIALMARLPGLGPRSARRAVLAMIQRRSQMLDPLAGALTRVAERVRSCVICGNLGSEDRCAICTNPDRLPTLLCVVEDVAALWAMERTAAFKGRYHVLGGLLSALDGVGPDQLRIPALVGRARESGIEEVVLALPATVDGQTTAHFIADQLDPLGIAVTSLAQGVPVGGELDYLDDGTISAALRARKAL